MKRRLFIFLFVLCPLFLFSQNLDKMPKTERDTLLVKRAKELVLRHGPGYWREYQPPIIERVPLSMKNSPGSKDIGRVFYYVNILFDPQKEHFNYKYAASVRYWADTGKPEGIMFGNGRGFSFYDDYESNTRSGQIEVMKFQTLDDQIKEEKEYYRQKGWEWKEY